MTRRMIGLAVVIVGLAAVVGFSQTEGVPEVLDALIRSGISAELDKGCGSEYMADERYTMSVTVEQPAYLMVFFFLSDGRTLLEFPFRGYTERRPGPLDPGVAYEVPTDWLVDGPGRFFIPRTPGETVALAIASEERLVIPYSTTRCEDMGVSQWLIAMTHEEAVGIILGALEALAEGAWWAGTACPFTFIALEPVEGEEELPPGFFRCP